MPQALKPVVPPRDKWTGFLTGHLRQFAKGRYPFMIRMKETYGDFVQLQLGSNRTYQLTDLDAVELILKKDARNYSKDTPGFRLVAEVTGNGVFTENGDQWLKIRKVVQPFFSKVHHEHWGKIVQECSQNLVEQLSRELKPNQPMLLSHYMTQIALSVLGRTVFNEDLGHMIDTVEKELSRLVEITNERMANALALPGPKKNRIFKQFYQSIETLDFLIDDLIARAKRAPHDPEHNMVHAFMQAPYKVDEVFLRDQVKTMVFAGHETTSSVLSWTLYLLAKHPEWLTIVENEIKNNLGNNPPGLESMDSMPELTKVFNESMRLYPPSWSLGRICENDTDLLGHQIKKGDVFIISPYLIHHDPKHWIDPEVFNPNRSRPTHPMAFIPFGSGPRACTGEMLARMEMMIIIPTLIQHFKIELPKGHIVHPAFQVSLRPDGGVPLILTPRKLS